MAKINKLSRVIKTLKDLNFSSAEYDKMVSQNVKLSGSGMVDDLLNRLEPAVRKITPKKRVKKVSLVKGDFGTAADYDDLNNPIIRTRTTNSPGTIAHELGHLFTHMKEGDGTRYLPSTINPIKAWKHMSGFINEELQASAKGLRAMKAAGYSPDDIERAREELKYALRSYKAARVSEATKAIYADTLLAAPTLYVADKSVKHFKSDKKDKNN